MFSATFVPVTLPRFPLLPRRHEPYQTASRRHYDLRFRTPTDVWCSQTVVVGSAAMAWLDPTKTAPGRKGSKRWKQQQPAKTARKNVRKETRGHRRRGGRGLATALVLTPTRVR
ncbi:unnamed protein product [Sphagnum troendelagicum]|uniref:Uncharacterized protein n=1 Tax=Sphagnum troendelagicum TaxID=128251 RepID=A0ABP0TSG3_9BRYO